MRFEICFLYLYDVGRSVDLSSLERAWLGPAAGRTASVERRLDTPESLLLPTPCILDLEPAGPAPTAPFTRLRFRAKVYEEGVVTIEARAEADLAPGELHTLRYAPVPDTEGAAPLDLAAERHFRRVMDRIRPHVNQDQYLFDPANREDYHVYCLVDPVADPRAFLETHRDYLAPFLLGENPELRLHESQVLTTLKTPFSFSEKDLVLFDMDRAFFIAPDRDYEDVLLILEHANYQLLELRTLDKLLDRHLDDAERAVRGRKTLKFRHLQPLRLDALFLLENLENSSRIIGDYYLEQIYNHLCGIFNTQGWKRNVERRLEILQSIYTLTKTERTDSTMVLLEFLVVVMIGLELVALFLPLVH